MGLTHYITHNITQWRLSVLPEEYLCMRCKFLSKKIFYNIFSQNLVYSSKELFQKRPPKLGVSVLLANVNEDMTVFWTSFEIENLSVTGRSLWVCFFLISNVFYQVSIQHIGKIKKDGNVLGKVNNSNEVWFYWIQLSALLAKPVKRLLNWLSFLRLGVRVSLVLYSIFNPWILIITLHNLEVA